MTMSSQLELARTMQALALDSSRVIAGRMAVLSRAHAGLSRRDRAELGRMVSEKQSAALESCMSLWTDALLHYQHAVFGFWTGFLTGDYLRMAHAADLSPKASLSSANRMLTPYRRRASANARRLSRRARSA